MSIFNVYKKYLSIDDSNGKVGIGTTNPSEKLHIDDADGGMIKLTRTVGSTSGELGAIQFGNVDIDNYLASIRAFQDGATDSGRLAFYTEETGGALTEKMRIDSSGNVGIGTTSPISKLHIENAGENNILVNTKAVASNAGLYLTEGGGATPTVNGAYLYYNGSSNKFNIATGTTSYTDRLTIERDTGNVGIGNTDPAYLLDVNGSGHFVGDVTIDGSLISAPSRSIDLTNYASVFETGSGDEGDYTSSTVDGLVKTTVKGRSWENLVTNGDFSDTSEWVEFSSVLSVSSNIGSITGDGLSFSASIYQSMTTVRANETGFTSARVRVTNAVCTRLDVYIYDGVTSTFSTINTPTQDLWYELPVKKTLGVTATEFRIVFRHIYADAATANGKVMEIDGNFGVTGVNLTALSETETDTDILAVKYPYHSGLRSTEYPSIEFTGVNLFDATLENNSIDANGDDTTSSIRLRTEEFLEIVGGLQNTIKINNSSQSGKTLWISSVYEYDSNYNFVTLSGIGATSGTLTFDAISKYIRVTFKYSDNTDITIGEINEPQIQLNLGSSATTYQPYTTNSKTLYDTLRSVPSAQDEWTVETGEVVKNVSPTLYTFKDADFTAVVDRGTDKTQLYTSGFTGFITDAKSQASDSPQGQLVIEDKYETTLLASGAPRLNSWYIAASNQFIYFDFPYGTSFADAKAEIVGKTVRYQLATPSISYIEPLQLQAWTGGQGVSDNKYEDLLFAVGTDITLAVKCSQIIKLYEYTGWEEVEVPSSDYSLASDGVTVTITGAETNCVFYPIAFVDSTVTTTGQTIHSVPFSSASQIVGNVESLAVVAKQNSIQDRRIEAIGTRSIPYTEATREIDLNTQNLVNIGNVGIGTDSPNPITLSGSATLDISSSSHAEIVLDHNDASTTSDIGAITFARDNDPLAYIRGTIDGAIDSARMSFYTQGTGGTLTSRMVIDSLGYVGIGTPTPGYALDVEGKINVQGSGATPGLRIVTDQGGGLVINANGTSANPTWLFDANSGEDIALQSTGGNVGIGTTNPDAILEIQSPTTTDALLHIGTTSQNYKSRISLTEENSNYGMVIENDGLANIGYIGMANNVAPDGAWSKRIQMSRNGLEVAFMAGNVGIGTTVPGAKLQVVESGVTAEATLLGSPFTNKMISIQGNGGAYFNARDVTNDVEFVMGTSSVGAGYLSTYTDHPLLFRTNNDEKMRILSNGNVGIGTTSPTSLLEVKGDVTDTNPLDTADPSSTHGVKIWNDGDTNSAFTSLSLLSSNTNGDNQIGSFVAQSVSTGYAPNLFYNVRNGAATQANLFTILGSGNVGIGTINPANTLHVSGTAQIIDDNTNTVIGGGNSLGSLDGVSPGSNNIGLGYEVLVGLTTGSYNIAIGPNVGDSITTGDSNIGMGYQSLLALTTGSGNFALGHYSLVNVVTGYSNVAIGKDAGYGLSDDGHRNIMIGASTLHDGDVNDCVALGYGSLYKSGYDVSTPGVGGDQNIGIGSYAVYNNTSGEDHVGIGYYALNSNTTGEANTGIGGEALRYQTTGSHNVAVGYRAGRYYSGSNQLGIANDCIFIGKYAYASANDVTNETVIGTEAVGNGSNSVTLGNDSVVKTVLKGAVKINVNTFLDNEDETLATVTETAVATYDATTFRSAKVLVQVYDTVSGESQLSELLVTHDGTNAFVTESGVIYSGASALATFNVAISTGNVEILATGASANSTEYKVSMIQILA